MATETTKEQPSFGGMTAEQQEPDTAPQVRTNGKKPMLTRAAMQDIEDFRIKRIDPEGYDFYFYVRSISAKGALELAELGDIPEPAEGGKRDRSEDIRKMTKIVMTCACDDKGHLIFTETEDSEWLMQRSIEFLSFVVRECMAINGLNKQGIEEAKGN